MEVKKTSYTEKEKEWTLALYDELGSIGKASIKWGILLDTTCMIRLKMEILQLNKKEVADYAVNHKSRTKI